jgi:P27 family predicted phage terminase small subunit
MAGQRQPIELVVANGRKHLTKAETEERRQRELKPCTDEITAPSYLTGKQKKEFNKIAAQLQKLKIMGETDCDTLARYVIAQGFYEQAVKDLRAVQKERPKGADADLAALAKWSSMLEQLDRRQERYFKQAQQAANALGLTISARCRLVAPVAEEKPKENKFSRFGKAAGGK